MSEDAPDFDHESFLVSTFMVFGGREFDVTVMHDGMSYWFDPLAKNQILAADQELTLKAAIFRGKELKLLQRIHDEWTVSAKVPDDGLAMIRSDLTHRCWSDNWGSDFDKRLDAILEPIFWKEINPQLSVPVSKSSKSI